MRKMAGITLVALVSVSMLGQDLAAQETRTIVGERYVPTIWVDPDGCEHWVMDDGAEGYGDNRLRRDGTPVCRSGPACAVFESDQMFATDQWRLSQGSRARLADFFRQTNASSFVISGHTDSVASDAYNMALSQRRANSVAEVARQVGARVQEVRWYGERNPVADNATAAGRQKNRRVEIECIG
jgi:outer membrane protein OmpA-like peptidoglycan-associated protein